MWSRRNGAGDGGGSCVFVGADGLFPAGGGLFPPEVGTVPGYSVRKLRVIRST